MVEGLMGILYSLDTSLPSLNNLDNSTVKEMVNIFPLVFTSTGWTAVDWLDININKEAIFVHII